MTRRIRYAVILIPALLLFLYLLKNRSPFGSRNTSFEVTPKNEITSIELSDGNRKLFLEKNGDDWIVNKENETRKSSILFILKILTEMQIKSPVTSEHFRSEIIEKEVNPVKVRVSEKGRTLRTFLVYKTPSNTYGNIMKLREGSKPYIVYVPGSEIDIGSAFTLNELYWQPYTIFNYLPSEIQSVTLVNSADSSASFKILKRDKSLSLWSLSEQLSGWDTTRLSRYISYFTHVPFESWALDLSPAEKDDIMAQEPLYTIVLEFDQANSEVLTLWKRSADEDGIAVTDTDRLWGNKNQGNEFFVVRYVDIDPLLKKLTYFFPQ